MKIEYYKLPLEYDLFGALAWTAEHNLALSFEYPLADTYCESIIKTINGDGGIILPNLRFEGTDFFDGDKPIFCVRGWGRLTGVGGLNLKEEEAVRIQDEFRDYIYNKLKG